MKVTDFPVKLSEAVKFNIFERETITRGFRMLIEVAHAKAVSKGWWTNLQTGEPLERNQGEMLMLMVTELAEGFEGIRKNLMDDKLPHRSMIEVEFADVCIRIADFAGRYGLDVGGAIIEKIDFNDNRADHKPENRKLPGGKAF